ncbi:MAG: DUF2520 domain-containing protein [Proteobacteria bacterium]|nr:DUF2520 domain-containing protein [Pseudomonadota bacterium]
MNIAIIGTGRMGVTQAHLARCMHDHILWGADCSPQARAQFEDIFGVPVYADIHSPDYAHVELLWLTVKDSDIESVARTLSVALPKSVVVLHTSGVLPSTIIKNHLPNNPCASFHPLMTCPLCEVSDLECVHAYQGVVHAYEGDESALEICRILAARLHAKGVQIQPERKILYHAAAVFSANYPTVLIDISVKLFEECGFSHEQAIESATLMCQQLLRSIATSGPCEALTGPLKRRDYKTVEAHIHALADHPNELLVYQVLKDACLSMLSSL